MFCIYIIWKFVILILIYIKGGRIVKKVRVKLSDYDDKVLLMFKDFLNAHREGMWGPGTIGVRFTKGDALVIAAMAYIQECTKIVNG
jgi:hypothetical protein